MLGRLGFAVASTCTKSPSFNIRSPPAEQSIVKERKQQRSRRAAGPAAPPHPAGDCFSLGRGNSPCPGAKLRFCGGSLGGRRGYVLHCTV